MAVETMTNPRSALPNTYNDVTAREVDFVTRFADNWDALRNILGIMRPIRKQPGTTLKSKKVKLLKVNVSGHNLFTLTGYSGWNPDVNSFGVNAGAYGIDYGSYPLRRQAVLGVSLKF